MRMLPLKGLAIWTSIFILAGCATPVDQLAEKPYCHTDRGRNAYCTKENAPSLKRDEEAKQFPSNPEALTVYVVRYWGDGHHPLDISVDGGTAMETVPNSMIRLRVKAGTHRISFSVGGKAFDRTISGVAGEVRLLGITGTDWSWGSSSHAWSDDSDDQVKRRAIRSRLIKDMTLLWAKTVANPDQVKSSNSLPQGQIVGMRTRVRLWITESNWVIVGSLVRTEVQAGSLELFDVLKPVSDRAAEIIEATKSSLSKWPRLAKQYGVSDTNIKLISDKIA